MAFTCTPNLLTHGPLATNEAGGVTKSHTSSYLIEGTASDFGTEATAPLKPLHSIISGLPQPGQGMDVLYTGGTSRLFVVNRTCRMETPTLAIVDVTWQQFETRLNTPDGIGTSHDVGTKTVTTSTDRAGQPIEVAFGANKQVASITVMDPEPVYSVELVIDVAADTDPHVVSDYYVGKVNSSTWRGYIENSWLCTAATPRVLNPYQVPWGFRRYVYSFRFVASTYGQGWNPKVEWIDANSRRPPDGLEDDVGRKLVTWYEAVDFNQEPQNIAAGL